MKKRLDDAKGKWVDELPYVLWTYHTTPRRSMEETLFIMTYGSKAVIPLEFGFPTLRMDQFNVEENHHLLVDNMDLAEERREIAMVKMASYQQKLKQMYGKGVKSRPMTPRYLVLRKVVRMAKNLTWGKLGPN